MSVNRLNSRTGNLHEKKAHKMCAVSMNGW